ncbi:MAG: diguanylate cyclase [Oscillospiraceae bacterium]|nr:diguanylate cyclase [Oscillospiraceae bacterium]
MIDTKKNSVLIVDDENANILALTHILSAEYTVYAAKNGSNAIIAAEKYMPDVILLDIMMPEMDGYAVLRTLKNTEGVSDIPVIFITGLSNSNDEEKGLDMGAADYIYKPFGSAIVKLRVKNQIKMINHIQTIELLSMIDQLTSISNRRGFDKRMDMEWIRAMRDKSSIGFLIMDVDKFKVYNDAYGHQQGDIVLQSVARTVEQSLNRPGDFAARWGGEEFVVLLPNTNIAGAVLVAELIRTNIASIAIPCSDGSETNVTISIGANSVIPKMNTSRDAFVADADKALYRAKETGRNRVCCAE